MSTTYGLIYSANSKTASSSNLVVVGLVNANVSDNIPDKMNTMGNEIGKRLEYNEWLKWWIRLTTLEQTLNNNGIQNNFDNEKRV